jgi:murein DD-endopeptidase MepM/ murein hydrolase activator NlpD
MRSSRTKIVRIISIVLAAVILLSLVSTALIVMVHAASSSEIKSKLADLRAKQAEIQKQSDELEKSIAENKDQTKTLVGQKAEIDQEMEMSRQKIENLNEQIQQLNLLIAEKQTELEASVAKEEALQKQYKARLRSMEETGSVSYWSILFRASSFSDLLDRVDMIREIAESDQLMLKQLSAATQAVETERADLEQQKLDLQQTEDDLAVEQAELETKRAKADTLITQMQAEYASLSDEFLAAEADEAAVREQIKKTETDYFNALAKEQAAAAAAAAAANKPSSGSNSSSSSSSGGASSGGFAFPLAYSTGVTCAYGPRVHPINGNKSFHYGVDLAAGMNTEIYATKSGTVTGATYGEANGYYVTINHGDGYSSIYAHMTNYVVSVGDSVKQGQLIGYVGTTGWSTGPHLHFEILYNGSNVNPMNYISLP